MAYPPNFDEALDVTQPLDTSAANLIGQDIRNLTNEIMQRMALLSGTLANRPAMDTVNATFGGSGFGWMYWCTDTSQIFQWNGSAWIDISGDFFGGVGTIATALQTTGSPVNVSAAAPPSANQVLAATDATHATWQSLGALTVAGSLQTTGSPVNVAASAPPGGAGYVLDSTDATHATWQLLSTLVAALVSGTILPLVQPTVTLKKGTNNASAYSTSSATNVDVDNTNFAYTVTIPTGWKLVIHVSGVAILTNAAQLAEICLVDGGTEIIEVNFAAGSGSPAGINIPFSMDWVINGDGLSHTIKPQFRTSAGTLFIYNGIGGGPTPSIMTIVYTLTPSN